MLSITAQHALRALVHLARQPHGDTMHGRDLARRADIPPNYLAKILWGLGTAGLIDARRGTGGGYKLRRPPAEIRLIDIVEVFDRPRVSPSCLLAVDRRCSDEQPCAAHKRWAAVQRRYLGFLENTTLATLATADSGPPPRRRPRRRRSSG